MTWLQTWHPFRLGFPRFNPFERLFEEFSPSVDREFPLINVGESDDGFLFTTELPGMEFKDIDVSVSGRTISIKGEIKKGSKSIHYFTQERIGTNVDGNLKFARHITLPVPIDASSIDAKYKDGVLYITVPKAEEVKPKSITIKVK